MELFALRGKLDSKQSLILMISGAVLVILFWFALSEILSKTIITQTDFGNDKIENSIDHESDLGKDLSLKTDEELSKIGYAREKVYPLLPSPISVVKSYSELISEDDLIGNTFFSIRLNFFGYVVAIILSVIIGFILGLVPLFRGLFSKIFDSFRFIPLTAVTGIFIMWFGLGSEMKISFLAFGIMVYLIPVVVQRIDDVNEVYLQTAFTIGASYWQTIKSVFVPFTFSKLIDDIRVLTAISWTYITITEMLNKGGGIGELIWMAKRQSRIDKAFAILIVIVLIGIIQDRLFVFLDKILFPHKYVAAKNR
ncbi:ABC transporter permease subunit [Lacihabitans sp. LS3-19]|uniref:ABC transporter permease n=1 Tax=Lacihabitans sp. LS3-19 TaxID=2487335 RepID=UPI0020CFC42D|nr:ABC transporter permease subunit [Lacihabitans sp. LS3-19]MCP9769466.1 ABC transporter permease subunit [Lacihabitans sp. LS3-19]